MTNDVLTSALVAAVTSVATEAAGQIWRDLQEFSERAPGGRIAVDLSAGVLFIIAWRLLRRRGRPGGQWRAAVDRVASAIARPFRVIQIRAIHLPHGFGRRVGRVLAVVAAGYLALCAGVLSALVGLLLIEGGGRLIGQLPVGSCDPPRELRVITALENVAELRERADAYTAQRRRGGCTPARISVGVAPSIEEMRQGLTDQWRRDDGQQENEPYRRMFGPTPDA